MLKCSCRIWKIFETCGPFVGIVQIVEFGSQKRCLQKDVDARTAYGYAEKAVMLHQLTWIAKSNSFHQSTKENPQN